MIKQIKPKQYAPEARKYGSKLYAFFCILLHVSAQVATLSAPVVSCFLTTYLTNLETWNILSSGTVVCRLQSLLMKIKKNKNI